MKRGKVVHVANLPVRVPIWSTVTLWLLLDRLHVEGWPLGVIWTFWGTIVALALAIKFIGEEQVKLFERDEK